MNDFSRFYREIAELEREAKRAKRREPSRRDLPRSPHQTYPLTPDDWMDDGQPHEMGGGREGFAPPSAPAGSFPEQGSPLRPPGARPEWAESLQEFSGPASDPLDAVRFPGERGAIQPDPITPRAHIAHERHAWGRTPGDESGLDSILGNVQMDDFDFSPRAQTDHASLARLRNQTAQDRYSPLNENWGWLDLAAGAATAVGDALSDMRGPQTLDQEAFARQLNERNARNYARREQIGRGVSQLGEDLSGVGPWLNEHILSDAPASELMNGGQRRMRDAEVQEGLRTAEMRRQYGPMLSVADPIEVTAPAPSMGTRLMALGEDIWTQPARDAREARGNYAAADYMEQITRDRGDDAQADQYEQEARRAAGTDLALTGSGALEFIPGVGLIDFAASGLRSAARQPFRAMGREVPEMLQAPARSGPGPLTQEVQGLRNVSLAGGGAGALGIDALDGDLGDESALTYGAATIGGAAMARNAPGAIGMARDALQRGRAPRAPRIADDAPMGFDGAPPAPREPMDTRFQIAPPQRTQGGGSGSSERLDWIDGGRLYRNPTDEDLARLSGLGDIYTLKYVSDTQGNRYVFSEADSHHNLVARALRDNGVEVESLGPGAEITNPNAMGFITRNDDGVFIHADADWNETGPWADFARGGQRQPDILDADFEMLPTQAASVSDEPLQAQRIDPLDPIMTRADGRPLFGMRADGSIDASAPGRRGDDVLTGVGLSALSGGAIGASLESDAFADDGGEGGDPLLPILGAGAGAATFAALRRGGFARDAASSVGAGGRPLSYDFDEAVRLMRDEGIGISEAARRVGANETNLRRTLENRWASGDVPRFDLQSQRGGAQRTGPSDYSRQSYDRLVREAEVLAEESGGSLPPRYSDILAERTGYEPGSIKAIMSQLRRDDRFGAGISERASALRGGKREGVNRAFLAERIDQNLSTQALTDRLNAHRQQLGLDPTNAQTVSATLSQIRRGRRGDSDVLAGLGIGTAGLGGAAALGAFDEAEAQEAIGPQELSGLDMTGATEVPGSRRTEQAGDGQVRHITSWELADGRTVDRVMEQDLRTHAFSEPRFYSIPMEAGGDPEYGARLRAMADAPIIRTPNETSDPFAGVVDREYEPASLDPALRFGASIGAGLLTRGMLRSAGGRGVAPELSGAIAAGGTNLAMGGDENEAGWAAGLAPLVRYAGQPIADNIGRAASGVTREAELSMSPQFALRRDRFAETLDDASPPLRAMSVEPDMLDSRHFIYGTADADGVALDMLPVDEVMEQGWARDLDVSAISPREQFLLSAPVEQLNMMERAARSDWTPAPNLTSAGGGVDDWTDVTRTAPREGPVDPERVQRGMEARRRIAGDGAPMSDPFLLPSGREESVFGEPKPPRPARAPRPPLEERAAERGVVGALQGVGVKTLREIAGDLGIETAERSAKDLRQTLVRNLSRSFDSTAELVAFLRGYGVPAAALGLIGVGLSETEPSSPGL